mgnify:FL=1
MLSFILQQSIHSRFHMIQNSRLPSILPFNLQIQDRKVSRFFYQLADSPYDPERLIGIPGIIIRIPRKNSMTIPKLMAKTFQNLFFLLFPADSLTGQLQSEDYRGLLFFPTMQKSTCFFTQLFIM